MKPRTWVAAALVLAIAACAKHPTAPAGPAEVEPTANSATGVVRRLAWTWNQTSLHDDYAAYTALFTGDFELVYAEADSAGGARAVSGPEPPYPGGSMTLAPRLTAQPDPRPGHAGRWHAIVRTSVTLTPYAAGSDGTPSAGNSAGWATFYVVRGDSAVLDPYQVSLGRADSTRWYVERWEAEGVRGVAFGRPPGAAASHR